MLHLMKAPASLFCALSLALSSPVQAQIDVAASQANLVYGTGIGTAGFILATDGSDTELITPCGNFSYARTGRYWLVHRHNPATLAYEQVWQSPLYAANDQVAHMIASDVHSAPGDEIVLATTQGRIEYWDRLNRSLLTSFTIPLTSIEHLTVTDTDDDGTDELLVCSADEVHAYELDGTQAWTLSQHGGYQFVVGQFDTDSGLEAATTDGTVVDLVSGQVQWQWLNGFGTTLTATDIDGDGLEEVICGSYFNHVFAFDIDIQVPKWSFDFGSVDALVVANVVGSAQPELLIGSGSFDGVVVYDLPTRTELFSVGSPRDVGSILVGDCDEDGMDEIVFGTGNGTTGPDRLWVADIATQQIEWSSPQLELGLVGPLLGDIDGDGNQEYVCVTRQQSSSTLAVVAYDAVTLEVKTISPFGGSSSTPYDLELADIDGDGDDEVLVAHRTVSGFEWNGTELERVWFAGPDVLSTRFRTIEARQLDADPQLEIVLGSNVGVHIYEYGAVSEFWTSPPTGWIHDVQIANCDGDPALEIFALTTAGDIYVYDSATLVEEALIAHGGVPRTAMDAIDGAPAMLAGDELGHLYLYLYNGNSYQPIGPLPIASAAIDSLGYHPAAGLLHVTSANRLALQFGLTPDWLSLDYDIGFGNTVSLDLATGRVASAGLHGLYAFDF